MHLLMSSLSLLHWKSSWLMEMASLVLNLLAQIKEDLTLKVDDYQSHVELLSRSVAQGWFLLSIAVPRNASN